jgi:hypothetical protein
MAAQTGRPLRTRLILPSTLSPEDQVRESALTGYPSKQERAEAVAIAQNSIAEVAGLELHYSHAVGVDRSKPSAEWRRAVEVTFLVFDQRNSEHDYKARKVDIRVNLDAKKIIGLSHTPFDSKPDPKRPEQYISTTHAPREMPLPKG